MRCTRYGEAVSSRHRLITACNSGVTRKRIHAASLAFAVFFCTKYRNPSRTPSKRMSRMSVRRWAVIRARSIAFCSQAGAFSLMAFRPSTVWRLRCFFSMRLIVLAAGLSGHKPLAAAWLKMSTSRARHWFAVRGVRASNISAIMRIVIWSTALPSNCLRKRRKCTAYNPRVPLASSRGGRTSRS
ncbi:hypothetical protein D3C85_1402710 [compost metagenome]